MSESVKVKFYFDIVSPFSYIGLERLFRHEKAWNLSIELCPIHLGTIIKSSDNFPPFSSSLVKRKYLLMDMRRSAGELQIPFDLQLKGPPTSSFDNMAVLKALKSLLPQEDFSQVVRGLYQYHSPGRHLHVPNSCAYSPRFDKAKSIAEGEEFRIEFEKEHADLINVHGAFGLPWIILQKPGERHLEYFWGSERISSIAHWLGLSYEYSNRLEIEA